MQRSLNGTTRTPGSLLRCCRVTAISAGKHHCMAVTVCGELLGFGRNKVGRVVFTGSPDMPCTHTLAPRVCATGALIAVPRPHPQLPPSTSPGATLPSAQHGQLGTGFVGPCWTPTLVSVSWTGQPSSYFRTSQVACGADHTLALVMHNGKLVPCAAGAGLGAQPLRGHASRHAACPASAATARSRVPAWVGTH